MAVFGMCLGSPGYVKAEDGGASGDHHFVDVLRDFNPPLYNPNSQQGYS